MHNRTKDKVQNTCGKAEQEEWRKWLNEHGRRLLFCARQWTSSQAEAEDVLQDEEGLMTLTNLAKNMAWLLKCIDLGRQNGLNHPVNEKVLTHFIR